MNLRTSLIPPRAWFGAWVAGKESLSFNDERRVGKEKHPLLTPAYSGACSNLLFCYSKCCQYLLLVSVCKAKRLSQTVGCGLESFLQLALGTSKKPWQKGHAHAYVPHYRPRWQSLQSLTYNAVFFVFQEGFQRFYAFND